MQNIMDFVFYRDQSSASTSADMKTYFNTQADMMSVEVSGTATSCKINIQGRTNSENNNEWFDLTVMNMTNLDIGTDIEGNGIYEVAIEGMREIRANIVSVSGGSVTVFGRAVNTGV